MRGWPERSFSRAFLRAAQDTGALLAAVLAIVLPAPASSAPASPDLKTLRQPDGTPFEARQWGDEWRHGWETAEGYTILFDSVRRHWVFAVPSATGALSPSQLLAGKHPAPAGVKPFWRGSAAAKLRRSASVRSVSSVVKQGTNNILTLMINFSDRTATYTPENFNTLLFGTGTNSMADYYTEISHGLFTVSSGPAGVKGWYQAPLGHNAYPTLPGNLVYEAVKAADTAGVDFQPYDSNGDCLVDVVNIIHQGTGQESSGDNTDIWSHSWSLTEAKANDWGQYPAYVTKTPCAKGGYISVDAYTIEPERFGRQMMTVGVFAHEYGHTLGLPDLYDTDRSSVGAGVWSLMADGTWAGVRVYGDRPSHMDPWSKYKLGWLTPQKVTSNLPASVTIYPQNSVASAFQFGAGGPNSPDAEYFLVENRQRSGFDTALPGSGMLVWHISESTSNNDKECYPGGPSCQTQHYKVALIQADNKWAMERKLSKGDGGDPFPGSSNNTSLNDYTLPNGKLYSGYNSTASISGVSVSQSNILATVSFGEPPKVALKYTKTGTGSGTVTFAPSGNLSSCSSSCSNRYALGTVVTLTAVAAQGSRFKGWAGSGGCTGKSTCTLTMSEAKAVKATFGTTP